jgi:hypothetical protein
MGVRLSIARLERAAVRRFGKSDDPCTCGSRPVVRIFDPAKGIVPKEIGPSLCSRCRKPRVIINVNIVETPLPAWSKNRDDADAHAEIDPL